MEALTNLDKDDPMEPLSDSSDSDSSDDDDEELQRELSKVKYYKFNTIKYLLNCL